MTLSSNPSRLQSCRFSDTSPLGHIGFDESLLTHNPGAVYSPPHTGAPQPTAGIKSLDSRYRIRVFTRDQDPDRAVRVEQIQGEAYVTAGYIYASALDDLGRLDNSNPELILDKARGSTQVTDVLYFHAVPAEPLPGRRDEGGLRIVTVSAKGSPDDLGAFSACKDSIGLGYQRRLYDAIDQRGPQGVTEITGLSLTNDADSTVSYALIREVLHRALHGQTNEIWLITFAMPAYLKMRKRLGDIVMPKIGDAFYAHRNDDPRTSNDLLLVPSIIDTPNVLENIARSAATIDDMPTARKQFATLRFMAEGLDDTLFPPFVRDVLREGI